MADKTNLKDKAIMVDKKKIDKERLESYESLPPSIKESLTEEEKEIFLTAKEWPESLFDKLDEFIIKD